MVSIANRYELQDEIGKGGMGTVYRGLDTQTGTVVAIKQLRPDVTNHEMLARFRSEGEALRELNHPNIVKMLAMVEEDDTHFLILEYMDKGDLRQLLLEERLSVERSLQIALDLADALTRAHRLNIIHRDIKPGNILIAPDGTPRLTDFGVAHIQKQETLTEVGSAVGTLDYLPPEAFSGEPVDVRADIWAFGVMLFEMLSGQRPFEGESVGIILNNILRESPVDLEQLAPDTPIALIDLVYRMLEKDLEARIPSVRIVGAELEAIMQGRVPESQKRFTPISEISFSIKHNLPADATPFVGRESEIDEISTLLNDPSVRLVTIIAQGGMGKTRLSLQVAQTQLENYSDGVYMVELAPLTDVESIIPAIADSIGYSFQNDGRSPEQQLLEYLSSRETLLVLDNYEHLLDGASIVSDLLQNAPKIKIIATSRQRLGQHGETLFHLIGMDFPDMPDYTTAQQYPAVRLFLNSAKRAESQFTLDVGNIETVVQICRMVQGMPLGIVLAASWLAMLSLDEIILELQEGMDILEAEEDGDIPERQKSIRAVMDYSWRHMNAGEQEALKQLSVFRGGFTRESAQKVAGANLRLLMSLVTKSLLRRDKQDGRYSIHELLRQYAEEQLIHSQQQEVAITKHARWYSDMLYQQLALLKGAGQLQAIANIESETDNIHLAWKNTSDLHLDDLLIQMITPFYLYTSFRSREVQLQEQLVYTYKTLQEDDSLLSGYVLAYMSHDDELVMEELQKALLIAEKHKDRALIAFTKRQQGIQLCHRVREGHERVQDGIDILNESLSLYRDLNDPYFEAYLLDDIAYSYLYAFKSGLHQKNVRQAKAIRDQIGDIVGISNGARGITVSTKNTAEAIAVLEEGLLMSQKIGNIFNMAWIHAMLCERYGLQGDYETANYHLQQSITINKDSKSDELFQLSKLSEAILALMTENDVKKAETLIYEVIPEDQIDQLALFSPVGFYGINTLLHLYAFKHDVPSLRRLLPFVLNMTLMNLNYLNWYMPLLAMLFYESSPQHTFVYLQFAYHHQEYGSAWMLKSPHTKAIYEEVVTQFPQSNYSDLYQQAEDLTLEDIRNEIKAMLAE